MARIKVCSHKSPSCPNQTECGWCPNLSVPPPSWRLLCRLEAGVTAEIRTPPECGLSLIEIRSLPFPQAACLPTWSSSPQISHLSNSRFEIPDSRLGNSYVHSPTKPDSSWRRKGEAEQADSQSVYCEGIIHNGLGKNRPRLYIKTGASPLQIGTDFARCLLPTACCRLPTAYCRLPAACIF